jgi:bacterioferritin-associated ferredoxin
VYVCICKGITQKQVEEAVSARKGQSSKDIMRSDCGTCVEDAVEQLLQASNKKPRRNHSPEKTSCHQSE